MIRCLALLVLPGWAPGLEPRWEGRAGALAPSPCGQKDGYRRGTTQGVQGASVPAWVRGTWWPLLLSWPPAPSVPLPIHVRTVPQIRELAAEMVGGADEVKGAVCAGNDLWGCSSRHWVSSHAGSVPALRVWGSRTGSGLSWLQRTDAHVVALISKCACCQLHVWEEAYGTDTSIGVHPPMPVPAPWKHPCQCSHGCESTAPVTGAHVGVCPPHSLLHTLFLLPGLWDNHPSGVHGQRLPRGVLPLWGESGSPRGLVAGAAPLLHTPRPP